MAGSDRHSDGTHDPDPYGHFAMSVHTAKSELSFQLPSMSYIDAKWEEPNLRAAASTPGNRRRGGLLAWVSRQVTGMVSWHRENQAAQELSLMSDRELSDIGLSRSDVGRVFQTRFNADLRHRGTSR
ncbi:DUF1127 domain-containing protein [Rhodopila sp.]|uniref:DUF1127 domain-containing protein n=1 Tax=Rhodopila sp. TaxID=2480087 RepID=UPI003D1492A5